MRPKDSVGFCRKRICHSTDMKGDYKKVKHPPTVKKIDDNFGTLKYSVILLLASARPLLFSIPGKEMLGKIGFQL